MSAIPLRALRDTEKIHKGGFYHGGRFKQLGDVTEHYDKHFGLKLSDKEAYELIRDAALPCRAQTAGASCRASHHHPSGLPHSLGAAWLGTSPQRV